MKNRTRFLFGGSARTAKRTALAGCLTVALTAVGHVAVAQQLARTEPLTVSASSPFEFVRVRDTFYVVSGPTGNVGVLLGPDGAVIVDTQSRELGDKLAAELRKVIGNGFIAFLLNTSADPGHAGANVEIRAMGRQIAAGIAADRAATAIHMAHDNVLVRLLEDEATTALVPQETFLTDWYDFFLNGEAIFLIHAPAAHTDGDSIVHFRESDVVMAGEIWNTLTYPVIDLKRGGSIQGVIDGLNKLIDLAVVRRFQEGGTIVVPGRGRIGDEFDVVVYRDMVTIIRDRIRAMAEQGMTLEQVKAARPTIDYDGSYGATSGPWTTAMFIAAVYEGVKLEQSQRTGSSR